ncbi:uncharacterized protein B0I36DRAFT_369890 [Microdochium trichocladiopsis]|uniref:Uncharacterized protein n=1 Tax=Microdochium trichocladiopsis TaxID=1682393 RepID=A0A9P8XQC1_9PEZI|nr:uncharacterized protein B0I36DRAFT_369890 [Microdochium trichocladiopsis]KAH7012040.1 hypothetical protein B0I36DRAFT_369890 [Microdochium trichocladiopsis]
MLRWGADFETSKELDLQTPKLDLLHKYLWLAGLPRPARTLHRQRLLGRIIVITENPDEHLVWHETSIFVKPLPEYLLSHDFWSTNLKIAHETGLLPDDVDWTIWTLLARDVIRNQTWRVDADQPRYTYGELRLVVFVYITVMLSAMQVALATDRFEGAVQFQQFA